MFRPLDHRQSLVLLCTLTITAGGLSAAEPAATPPWKGQYKIRASETTRLTAADVVGPDGIVYPNWTHTGVQGGIPKVQTTVTIKQFGGRADDNQDDSAALDRACEAVGRNGGGVVLLDKGSYHLDWPVTIRHHKVVIRGQGRDATRIIFRYALPASGITFYGLKVGDRIGNNTPVILHARPKGLATMHIEIDGQVVHTWTRGVHSGNTFATGTTGKTLIGRFPAGEHKLRGVAQYQDKTVLQMELPVLLDATFRDARFLADWKAALLFAGKGYSGPPLKLVRDAHRGDRTLNLTSAAGLSAGDGLHLVAPATERWKTMVRNACPWGSYREYEALVEKVEGNWVTLGQPLRIDFPIIDGSFVRKVVPIQHCGVEDLSLEQTEDLWISGVLFSHAWNCRARGVTVKKCGRFPVYGSQAKWCEIRDCVFDNAWFKGGGGTAYSGWDHCWDCLMENVETYQFRHAPLFQWAASGNVIRKSTFHGSDGQWHSGWTHENLMEQCVIESSRSNGSYGYGLWASPPEDTAHGPNGPRNVVYNCDIRSPRTGLWMGGMNENWLILYNRFWVETGNGVYAKTASFDHVIRGNVFVLRDSKASLIHLATPDCTGVEILDNQFYGGNGKILTGPAQAAVVKGNRTLPLSNPPRPTPAVPSIYDWQRAQLAR
jgi:hypothetical protein